MGIRRLIAFVLVLAGACLFAPGLSSAAVFTVNSTGQELDANPGNGACSTAQGTCTVRAALQESNALIGTDTVNVPAGNYPVGWSPQITQSVVLRGTAGARATRMTASGNNYWSISGGGVVEISGLTFTGTNGINSAVAVNGPDTTFRGVSIEGNRSTSSSGAGLRISSGQVTLIRSAVVNNLLDRSSGDAIGGGIAVFGGNLTAIATTIAGNEIKSADTKGWGGGIFSNVPLALSHVTMRENSVTTTSAANYGGNLFLNGNDQVMTTIQDSIITGGSTSSGQSRNCGKGNQNPPLTVTGKNIYESLGAGSCAFPPASVAAASATLTELDDHGGPGPSYVPLASSAAVDAASSCPQDGFDQRGVAAPAGAACDIGSTELSADLKAQLVSAAGPVAAGTPVFHTVVLSNAGPDTAESVTLGITPPSGLSILAVSGGTCTAEGQCSFGDLEAGLSRTVTFTTLAPASGSLVTQVTGDSISPDPTPADTSASATTGVIEPTLITGLRVIGKLRSGSKGRIGLKLARPATVRIVVSRIGRGRLVEGVCKAGAKAGKRCQTLKKVGVLSARKKSGQAVIRLPAKLRGKKLKPGRYRLTATATTASGTRSKASRITVKVLKAGRKR